LREVRQPDGRRVLFTYDAFGRRVRKEIVPAERRDVEKMVPLAFKKGPEALPPIGVVEYLWDGDALAGEFDPERGARFFVHEPGTLVPMLQQEQGEVFTYVNDHLGMPKELVDEDGRVAWAAAHSAWGRVVEAWRDPGAKRAVDSPFRLLGQYLDDETGLCFTRFRCFDPEVGRWLSPDPLGIAGGKNLFAFDGSPTVDVDPLGLCRVEPLGRGSTANGTNRWLPRNLREQLAVDEAMQRPAAGESASGALGDTRWPAGEGWVKLQRTVDAGGREGPMSIHYNYNTQTGEVDDFKLVERKPYVPPPDPKVPPGVPRA
jgi:RHS repeat-associated protein